jgi:sec-independent protein translocase protein TatA
MLAAPMIATPGGWELVLIVFVLILLFGAKKLPDLARGTGRALRIFKTETRGLMDDEDAKPDERAADNPRPLPAGDTDESAEARQPSADQSNPTHRPHGES